ncbi:MAG: hypothetical protein ACKOEO_07555 [Planctomycetaceae bacterium]
MSRRERFIPPTPEQLPELQQAELTWVRLADQRRSVTEKALRRTRKETLVQLLMDWSAKDIAVCWRIEAALQITKPLELLLYDLRRAIALATQTADTRLNRDVPVDYEAYAEIRRLMGQLVSAGFVAEAMEVAIEFMDLASYQLECSDQGLMQEEIEEGLQPLLAALEDDNSPRRAQWAAQMQHADRVGSVCWKKLQEWSSGLQR